LVIAIIHAHIGAAEELLASLILSVGSGGCSSLASVLLPRCREKVVRMPPSLFRWTHTLLNFATMIPGAGAALTALTSDGWVCNVGASDREGCALAWAASGGQMRRCGTGTSR